jgi:multidrug resistance efflux pump
MRSLNFKRRENSQLRYLEEKISEKQKARFNWDRVVYLLILGTILFFVLRYFFLNNFFISADGQIIFDSVEISETQDVRIEKYYIEEGQDVKKGDTLFTYLIEDPIEMAQEMEMAEGEEDEEGWSEREMYTLQKNIDLNNSRIRGDSELLDSYKKQLKRMENEVILGAASDRDLANLEYQISKLETEIKLKRSENGVLKRQLLDLGISDSTMTQLQSGQGNPYSPYRVFIAPVDGYIAKIYKEPYEVALKSEVIITIYQSDSVYIKGYFEQEDLRYVKEGDIITVNFPDGKQSEGKIKRFYSSTVLVPEEFQKRFEPAKRTIAADVVPAPGSDLEIWKRYYKLSVKLNKRTF